MTEKFCRTTEMHPKLPKPYGKYHVIYIKFDPWICGVMYTYSIPEYAIDRIDRLCQAWIKPRIETLALYEGEL